MKKIDIKERQPEKGQKVLAYGNYWGEIYGDADDNDKDWYLVEYGIGENTGVGGDCYMWGVSNIEFWIDLSEVL